MNSDRISEETYQEAVKARDDAQQIINAYWVQRTVDFKTRLKENPVFTDDELTYSRHLLCPCGHGMAYPRQADPFHYWDCSAILKGVADKDVKHTDQLPFTMYDLKSEDSHLTTRGVFRPKAVAGIVLLFCFLFPSVCSAQVVQLHTSTGKGSAVCVGATEADGQLFVTVRHNFEDGPDGRIQFKDRWHAIDNLELSESEDLACFTSHARTKPLPIFEGSLTQGAEVDVPGFGPLFNGRDDSLLVRHGRVEDLELVVNSDSQVVPGDSGCPVVYEDRTVGIVRAFFNDSPRETQIIPAVKVHKFLTRCQWQCMPGQDCYIRQRVRQPIAGIAIPIGPPQIETQIIPRQTPRPQPIPDENFSGPKVVQGPRGERGPAGERGEKGERGAQGPAGKDGSDGADGRDGKSFTAEELSVAVAAWLEANRTDLRSPPPSDAQVVKAVSEILYADADRFRGPPGKDGSPGSAGPKGDRYVAVPDDEAFKQHVDRWLTANPQYKDLPGLAKRIAEIESLLSKKQPVRILNNDGTLFSEDKDRGLLDPIVIRLEEPK